MAAGGGGLLSGEKMFPQVLREFFNRVAKHGPGHGEAVGVEEVHQLARVPFAGFAQHPSAGFVDEVLRGIEEMGGEGKCFREVALADKGKRRDDGDSLFPEDFRGGEFPERIARAIEKVGADDFIGRDVHEIPIVDPRSGGKIEIENGFLDGGISPLESPDQNQECQKAFLMPRRVQEPPDVRFSVVQF